MVDALPAVVSLVSPFYQQSNTQHLAKGLLWSCDTLSSCSDAERIVSQMSKEIVLHAELACTLWAWPLRHRQRCSAEHKEFVGAKEQLLGASCSDAQPWQALAQEISQL